MLFTLILPVAQLLDQAVLAEEVLAPELVLRLHRGIAVLHASEVRLLALEALVEGALLHGELERLPVKVIAFGLQSLTLKQALPLSHLERFSLDLCLEVHHAADLSLDLPISGAFDRLLAAWAA